MCVFLVFFFFFCAEKFVEGHNDKRCKVQSNVGLECCEDVSGRKCSHFPFSSSSFVHLPYSMYLVLYAWYLRNSYEQVWPRPDQGG